MENTIGTNALEARKNKRDEDIRGAYFRDQTAIVHSMPFRRLKHKTQVFFDPDNDHVCTRIEHVLHVATIAASICKGINKNGGKLNEELATAIGQSHDIGHAPFGHAGESKLNKLLGKRDDFFHEVHGLRTVDCLASCGEGLNLTYGVRDGIICHNGEKFEQEIEPRKEVIDLDLIKDKSYSPVSFEGCVVRMSDKIAYLGRDIEDALIANIVKKEDLPELLQGKADKLNSQIINHLVTDVIETSSETGKISLSENSFELMKCMKDFNYEVIYNSNVIVEYIEFCEKIIESLFEFLANSFADNRFNIDRYSMSSSIFEKRFGHYINKMRAFYTKEETPLKMIVADYISGMTDKYALECMKQITIPKAISFMPQ